MAEEIEFQRIYMTSITSQSLPSDGAKTRNCTLRSPDPPTGLALQVNSRRNWFCRTHNTLIHIIHIIACSTMCLIMCSGIICHSSSLNSSVSLRHSLQKILKQDIVWKISCFIIVLFRVVLGLNSGSLPSQAQDCSLERLNQEECAYRTLCLHTAAISTLARAAGESQASRGALLVFP